MAATGGVAPASPEQPLDDLSGLSAEIVTLLEQPLNRKLVARRKSASGDMLRYLELCGMEPRS
jgi:hypothetical protein